jgi:hypothetical protein
MYAGHFAAAFVLKARTPSAPTWGLVAGVGFLDILFGPFVLAGIERVSLTPNVSPGFSLDYIDWSHSLVMSAVWSAVFGALFLRKGRAVATVMALAVFSHFLLDLLMHPADLALWPGSSVHLGFGLWRIAPPLWWFVELVAVGGGMWFYWRRARTDRAFGRRAGAVVLTVILLHVINSPWLSAM